MSDKTEEKVERYAREEMMKLMSDFYDAVKRSDERDGDNDLKKIFINCLGTTLDQERVDHMVQIIELDRLRQLADQLKEQLGLSD